MKLQPIRGTHDLLPEEIERHNLILNLGRKVCEVFGYREMSTPIMESSQVFKRTLGEQSDIVHKEMYTFEDRGGDEITLRPEGTASISRAFISKGLSQRTPLKVFYHGPMFRYERPQKGRLRQFHQFGVELMGAASPLADVEVIALAYEWLKQLAIDDKVMLELNSIGDVDSRKNYREKLLAYLTPIRQQLSEDSQKRLDTNPLRILDSKSEADQRLLENAPKMQDSLSIEAKEYFSLVKNLLEKLGIPYTENSCLVRGLDYYSHTVFEFRTPHLGAQDAVISGGRYDQLVQSMGGPDTPSVGWAAGMERVVLLCPLQVTHTRPVAVIPVHNSVENDAFLLTQKLRLSGVPTEIGFSGNMSKRMKKTTVLNCRWAIIVGPDELAKQEVTLKDLDEGKQENLSISQVIQKLKP